MEAWRRNWRRWRRLDELGHVLAAAASSSSSISIVTHETGRRAAAGAPGPAGRVFGVESAREAETEAERAVRVQIQKRPKYKTKAHSSIRLEQFSPAIWPNECFPNDKR